AGYSYLLFRQRDQSQVVVVGREFQTESGGFQPAPCFGGGKIGSCSLAGSFLLRPRIKPCKIHSESATNDEVALATRRVGEAEPRPEIPIIVLVGLIAVAKPAPGEVHGIEQPIQIPRRGGGLVVVCPGFLISRRAAVDGGRRYFDGVIVIFAQSQIQDQLRGDAPVILDIERIARHAPPGAGDRPAQGYSVRRVVLNIGQRVESNIAGLLVVKSTNFETDHRAKLQGVWTGEQRKLLFCCPGWPLINSAQPTPRRCHSRVRKLVNDAEAFGEFFVAWVIFVRRLF